MSEKNPSIASLSGVGLPRLILELETPLFTSTGGSVFTSTTAKGYIGKAVSFDGATERVAIADASCASLKFERTSSFSVGLWLKRSAVGTANQIVAKRQSAGDQRGYSFGFNASNQLTLILRSAAGNLIQVTTTTAFASTTAWYHVGFSYDGSSTAAGVKIYANGVSQTLTVNTDALAATIDNTEEFAIGAGSSGGSEFAGSIGELVVVPAVLAAATFLSEYDNGVAGSYNEGAVVAFYNWRGSTDAAMLSDKSASGYNLTGTNVTQAGDQVVGDYRTRDRLSLVSAVGMLVTSYEASGSVSKPTFGRVTSIDTVNDELTLADGWSLGTPTNGQVLTLGGYIADLPRTQDMTETYEPDHLIHELYDSESGATFVETEFRGWRYTCVLDYSRFLSTDAIFDMKFHLGQKSNDRLVLVPRRDAPQFQHEVYIDSAIAVSKYPRTAGIRKSVFTFRRKRNLASWPLIDGYGTNYATSFGTNL